MTRVRVFLLFLMFPVHPDLIIVNYFREYAALRHSCFCKRRREEKRFSSPCRKFLHGMKRNGRTDRVNFFAFANLQMQKRRGGKGCKFREMWHWQNSLQTLFLVQTVAPKVFAGFAHQHAGEEEQAKQVGDGHQRIEDVGQVPDNVQAGD